MNSFEWIVEQHANTFNQPEFWGDYVKQEIKVNEDKREWISGNRENIIKHWGQYYPVCSTFETFYSEEEERSVAVSLIQSLTQTIQNKKRVAKEYNDEKEWSEIKALMSKGAWMSPNPFASIVRYSEIEKHEEIPMSPDLNLDPWRDFKQLVMKIARWEVEGTKKDIHQENKLLVEYSNYSWKEKMTFWKNIVNQGEGFIQNNGSKEDRAFLKMIENIRLCEIKIWVSWVIDFLNEHETIKDLKQSIKKIDECIEDEIKESNVEESKSKLKKIMLNIHKNVCNLDGAALWIVKQNPNIKLETNLWKLTGLIDNCPMLWGKKSEVEDYRMAMNTVKMNKEFREMKESIVDETMKNKSVDWNDGAFWILASIWFDRSDWMGMLKSQNQEKMIADWRGRFYEHDLEYCFKKIATVNWFQWQWIREVDEIFKNPEAKVKTKEKIHELLNQRWKDCRERFKMLDSRFMFEKFDEFNGGLSQWMESTILSPKIKKWWNEEKENSVFWNLPESNRLSSEVELIPFHAWFNMKEIHEHDRVKKNREDSLWRRDQLIHFWENITNPSRIMNDTIESACFKNLNHWTFNFKEDREWMLSEDFWETLGQSINKKANAQFGFTDFLKNQGLKEWEDNLNRLKAKWIHQEWGKEWTDFNQHLHSQSALNGVKKRL